MHSPGYVNSKWWRPHQNMADVAQPITNRGGFVLRKRWKGFRGLLMGTFSQGTVGGGGEIPYRAFSCNIALLFNRGFNLTL